MLDDISSTVTRRALQSVQQQGLLLHAGAVADHDGRVLSFIAPSGMGKTTASLVLGRHYGYVSDETTFITDALGVEPFRKPLSIVETDDAPKRQVAPGKLGLLPLPPTPLRIGALVLLDRRNDAPRPFAITDLDPVDAIRRLVPQLSFAADDRRLFDRVANVIASTGGIALLSYADASDLVGAVPALLARAERFPAPHLTVDPPGMIARSPLPGYCARASRVSSLAADGRLLVHVGETVLELDGLGIVLWRLLAHGPLHIDELASRAVAELGEPPSGSPTEALAIALAELSTAGVLEHWPG